MASRLQLIISKLSLTLILTFLAISRYSQHFEFGSDTGGNNGAYATIGYFFKNGVEIGIGYQAFLHIDEFNPLT